MKKRYCSTREYEGLPTLHSALLSGLQLLIRFDSRWKMTVKLRYWINIADFFLWILCLLNSRWKITVKLRYWINIAEFRFMHSVFKSRCLFIYCCHKAALDAQLFSLHETTFVKRDLQFQVFYCRSKFCFNNKYNTKVNNNSDLSWITLQIKTATKNHSTVNFWFLYNIYRNKIYNIFYIIGIKLNAQKYIHQLEC
jgi:hypothetical protein